jgi:hypothetical protein
MHLTHKIRRSLCIHGSTESRAIDTSEGRFGGTIQIQEVHLSEIGFGGVEGREREWKIV